MRWFDKKTDKQALVKQGIPNVNTKEDTQEFLKKNNLKGDELIEAEIVFNKTLEEAKRVCMTPGSDVNKLIETIENYILAVVPVRAKAFALSKFIAETISMRMVYDKMEGAIKKSLHG